MRRLTIAGLRLNLGRRDEVACRPLALATRNHGRRLRRVQTGQIREMPYERNWNIPWNQWYTPNANLRALALEFGALRVLFRTPMGGRIHCRLTTASAGLEGSIGSIANQRSGGVPPHTKSQKTNPTSSM